MQSAVTLKHWVASRKRNSAMERMRKDIEDTARAAAGTIADKAEQAASEAKAQGANQIADVSRAIHDAADALGHELPQASQFIHSAAEKLDGASSALGQHSIEELLSGFNGFARRQPAAAFAGSVLAGFALSRFLKSSAAPR